MTISLHDRRTVVTIVSILTVAVVGAGSILLGTRTNAAAFSATAASEASAGRAGALFARPASAGLTDLPVAASPSAEPVPDPRAAVQNVIILLADDLDWAAFDAVPRLAALKAEGVTFTNHTVTDALCCPSRVSMLRGQYVHNHRVVSNMEATGGGFGTYYKNGDEADSLPVWLAAAGASNGYFGKYLNEYPLGAPRKNWIPPGWDAWGSPVAQGVYDKRAYGGFRYTMNHDGTLKRYGSKPTDFLNDVLNDATVSFIGRTPTPFFTVLASYNPHRPFPIAPQHWGTHEGEQVPRTPSFNATGTNEPKWRADYPTIKPNKVAELDRTWQRRLRSTESFADSVVVIREALQATGHDKDTLLIVTSDNGFHLGNHRMLRGKRTAYREDAVVPLVMIGPNVPAGLTVNAMTSPIDLAPTVAEFLKAPTPAWLDGRSLIPLLAPDATIPWRTAVLSEAMSDSSPGDPDFDEFQPPRFSALRSQQWLYVTYEDGETELYDLVNDPYEMRNIAGSAPKSLVKRLAAQTAAMSACAGASCRVADAMPQ